MTRSTTAPGSVSPNNPCPFLRALVAHGLLADDTEPVATVTQVVQRVARAGEGTPELPYAAVYAIALIANGLGPASVARSARHGVGLSALRGGPLDKKGVGSGILDQHGAFDPTQFARLEQFASDKRSRDGAVELGLDLRELRRFMDANFERAAGRRRRIDRRLMDGEWPVLLRVLGKEGSDARYLSVAELRALFAERRLPERMLRQAAAGPDAVTSSGSGGRSATKA
jgi:hypothetical protein